MTHRTEPSVLSEAFIEDVIQIQGVPVVTRVGMLDQTQLQFWVGNPRVYSIVRENGGDPSQDDIRLRLQDMEHVRTLVHDVKKHGGLIDPLVVKDKTFEVVEGNSRLAAYRFLAGQNPTKWARIKCRVLPADIRNDLVASLLGQWHLKGKKEWPPFEQAGYLYRRKNDDKVSSVALAGEAGISAQRVDKIIEAYQLMLDQNDAKRDRWSYYDEVVKSKKIMKVCEAQPAFKDRVLKMIKQDSFERAQDVRDKLPVICEAPPKVRTKFATGKIDFDEAYDAAKEAGGGDARFQRLHKFRTWLADTDVQDDLVSVDGALSDKVDFELKKLQTIIASILKKRS
jgi:hypothetical protein